MPTRTTKGISITVEPFYLPHESVPVQHRYVHAYRITIVNKRTETVQLLSRHWFILESNGFRREVKGEGVVGQQPVLAPGEQHQYTSWCPLVTDFGKMYGSFHMVDTENGTSFDVRIPEFSLFPPFKMN